MDAEELRKSMISEVKESAFQAGVRENQSRLLDRLLIQGKAVRARFRAVSHGPDRRKLNEIYQAIDGLLKDLKKVAAISDEEEKTARWRELEKQGEALVEAAKKLTAHGDDFREEVEKGRKRVVEKAAAGAGANTQKRIRDELNYLIDHYTPDNDNKIETLIDKWRRSGDPSYDPMIRIKYRNARKKKSTNDYAF